MDMNKTLINSGAVSAVNVRLRRKSLTSAMTAMRGMIGADNRFTKQSLERYVAVVISSGFVFDRDLLDKETEPLSTAGVNFISIGKGISSIRVFLILVGKVVQASRFASMETYLQGQHAFCVTI